MSGARAELSADACGTGGASGANPRPAETQALIDEARRRAAAEQERAGAEEESRRRAALAGLEARLPPGERLIERHCASCHDRERIAAARHSRLGWALTVARMRYLNRAPIPAADGRAIAAHLAFAQPAGLAQNALEHGLALALLLVPAGAIARRLYRRCAGRRAHARST